jgi:hypothetical protein
LIPTTNLLELLLSAVLFGSANHIAAEDTNCGVDEQ